jgi:hypothetical protein
VKQPSSTEKEKNGLLMLESATSTRPINNGPVPLTSEKA